MLFHNTRMKKWNNKVSQNKGISVDSATNCQPESNLECSEANTVVQTGERQTGRKIRQFVDIAAALFCHRKSTKLGGRSINTS